MFLAAGPTVLRFCEWVDRIGEAVCVAFMEGAAPVEAAARAVLVAARLPATTTRGHAQQ